MIKRISAIVLLVAAFLPQWIAPASGAGADVQQTWRQLSPPTSPEGRIDPVMAYDAAASQLIMFGGCSHWFPGCNVTLGDTWRWTGQNWVLLKPATSPPALDAAAMAYDPQIRRLLLFGGQNSSGVVLGDTWEWTGHTWAQMRPAAHPSPRDDPMMSYDGATRQLILFGGTGSGGDLGDTWVWAAGNWHHKSSPAAPLPRYSGSMSYDHATRQLILFGGWADNGLTFYGDTWTWTGCKWKELTPAAAPPARARASMAFDAATGQLLLFGGWGPAAPYDWGGDTWAWTGETWVNLHPAVSPPARADAAMAYDDATAQVILFGGDIDPPNGKAANDTWTWTS